MNEEIKRKKIHKFFTIPEPKHDFKSIAIGAVIAAFGIYWAISIDVGLGLIVIFPGVLISLLSPLRAKDKLGSNQDSSPIKLFNVIMFPFARKKFESRVDDNQIREWLFEDVGFPFKAGQN